MASDNIILDGVILDLQYRATIGFKKYGRYLHENEADNMLQHAYEEALDLAMYLKTELARKQQEREVNQQLPFHLGDYL